MAQPPAPISPEQVAHLARLARLELSAEEAEGLGEHLRRMLSWVADLEAVDSDADRLEEQPGLSDAVPVGRLRPDATRPSLDPERALANAPQRAADGGFATPPVLSGGEG